MKNSICFLGGVLTALSSANGALVLNDSFDYGDADIPDGVGSWSDASNNVRYENSISSVFTGTGYVHTGEGGSIEVNTSSNRGMQSSLGGALSGEFWVSGMTRNSSTTPVNARSGSVLAFNNNNPYSATSATGMGFGVGLNGDLSGSGDREVGIWDGSVYTSVTTGAAVPTGAWRLFVTRMSVNTGNDSMDIWYFASNAVVPTTVAGLGIADLSASGSDLFGDSVSNIWAGAGNPATDGSSVINWDDIRVSDLSGQNGLSEVLTGTAVPEPSTTMMLFCGLGAIVGFRRRN